MGRMKEALMDIEEYILEHMDDFFAPEDMPLDDDTPDRVQHLISIMDDDELFNIFELTKVANRRNVNSLSNLKQVIKN